MTTINEAYLRPRLLERENNSHKGDYGHLLVVAGCQRMPGAAVLATGAALRSGCGLVTLHSTRRALQAAINLFPSAMLSEDPSEQLSRLPDSGVAKYDAIAAGPGLGREPQTGEALKHLLTEAKENSIPMVIDADAITLIALDEELKGLIPPGSVLTPHLGELRRLIPFETEKQKEAGIRELCERYGCVLVEKGFHSKIFTPEGDCLENSSGNPGMAKGGSGDVLTGLVGGLLARGYEAVDAAALGVWIHGYAGDTLTAEKTAEAYDSAALIEKIHYGFRKLYDL